MQKVGAQKVAGGKKLHLPPPELAQCGSHTVNTMLLEGSGHLHLDDFWVVLGLFFRSPKATSQGVQETGWNFDGFGEPVGPAGIP